MTVSSFHEINKINFVLVPNTRTAFVLLQTSSRGVALTAHAKMVIFFFSIQTKQRASACTYPHTRAAFVYKGCHI